VYALKKTHKYGLLLLSMFAIFSFTSGCFGGLDNAQKTAATYVNALYAKTDTPSAEERYQKLVSTISTSADANPSEHKDDIIKIIQEAMIKGLVKPYYIADNLNEPQSDTRRSVIVRIPKGSFTIDESNLDKDFYVGFILTKEGDDWKILDFKEIDENISQEKIEWQDVEPTDYLG
jgi:hypothetical protein